MVSQPTAATMRVAAVGSVTVTFGVAGTVLRGGPLGLNLPTLDALLIGVVCAGAVVGLAIGVPARSRIRFARLAMLGLIPFLGVAAAMYASPEFNHFALRTSALGWILVSTLPLIAATAAYRSGRRGIEVDAALGGTVGVALAALVHVAVAEHVPLDSWWAVLSWVAGALVASAVGRLPPQAASRMPLGPAWRMAPAAFAWIMALITMAPAAPRHEISTSAGAQVLAVTVSVVLLLACAAVWRSEAIAPSGGPWTGFRAAMREFSPTTATVTLLLVGGLQAASYSEVTIDDLSQFWHAADALGQLEYAVWSDRAPLPGLPVLLLASFGIFGRTFPAALAPMFLANALLPWLIWRGAIAAGAGRTVGFAVAILATVLPVVQIYSLGSAEPDPVFIAVLAATAWSFVHVLRTREPRFSLLGLGGCAGLVAVIRPEGLLYAGLLLLAGLAATRSRWAVAGCAMAGSLTAPVVAVSLANFGRPWPTFPPTYSITTAIENAQVVGGVTIPQVARVVLLNDVRFPLLLGVILALSVIGSAQLVRGDWWFLALPAAVVANIVVKLSISSYMVVLRPEFPPELVRHMAYPLPIVAVLAAVGIRALARLADGRGSTLRMTTRIIGVLFAVYLVAGSLYVLATPEEFHHGNRSGSLFADNIYVNAPELWLNPFPLPEKGWDFFAYRDRLFAWYGPFDNHSDTSGMAYQALTGTVAAAGLAALLVAAPPPIRPERVRRTASTTAGPRPVSRVSPPSV